MEATTAAAVAVKVAVAAPFATSTEVGTVKADVRLLASVTVVPPSGAVLESVTVQVVVAAAARLVLPHCSELIVIEATRETLAVALTLFSVAVTVADWFAVNEPAVALKVAVVALAAIVTVAGTVIFPVEANAIVPPDAKGLVIVAVQIATAPGASEAGLQANPLSNEVVVPVTVPPAAVSAIWDPSRAAPIPPETPIEADVALAASPTTILAITPSEMRLPFMPLATQI